MFKFRKKELKLVDVSLMNLRVGDYMVYDYSVLLVREILPGDTKTFVTLGCPLSMFDHEVLRQVWIDNEDLIQVAR